MKFSPRARLVATLAIASLLAVGLGGCFVLPFGHPRPSASPTHSHKPGSGPAGQTGDCWKATHRHMADWSSWDGAGPVACSEDHQSYTYLAADLKDDIANPYDADGMTADLGAAVSKQCDDAFAEQFPWGDSAARVGVYFFVPTKEEWDAGDHVVRCDLAVLALGSDYLDPRLEPLPEDIADLVGDVKENPDVYEVCLFGDGVGPYESTQTELINCTDGDYLWRLGGSIDYPAGVSIPYPGDGTLSDYGTAHCPALGVKAGETVLPYTPTEDYWAQGARSIECWFSLAEEPPASA